jgi:mannose-1-phosphate guanylyltransferase
MKAVVLAGGEGRRLKPLTETRPKPLIPVAGRPCIDYVIKSLVTAGFKEIIVTTCYMSDTLIRSIGDGSQYDASILYSFEGQPAGTAGAVKKVEDYLSDTFVVASGDVLADVKIKSLFDYHKKKGAKATIALTEVKNPEDFGIVILDKNQAIVRFKEKPKKEEIFSNLINAGIYILEPEVLDVIPENEKFDFSKNVFPKLLENNVALFGKKIKGLWRDIGHPEDLLNASLEIVNRTGEELKFEGVETNGKIITGKNVIIESGVTIHGPCYIGNDATISKDALLENSCVYDNAFVDRNVVLQNSILLEGAKVGWQSEIRDSIISKNCSIEHNCKIMTSLIGDDMTIKKHSTLVDANITPPQNTS